MNTPEHNEGIIISGGTLRADALAVGRYSRAIHAVGAAREALTERGEQDVAERMGELMEQLRLHADELRNPGELLEATESVAAELTREKPNKLTAIGVLTGIAGAVASVAGVTEAVDALIEAVRNLG